MTDRHPQVGGSHYAMPIEPIDFILANDLGYSEGNVLKYLCRYRRKGTPVEDLLKAQQYLTFLIDKVKDDEASKIARVKQDLVIETLSEELDRQGHARRTGW